MMTKPNWAPAFLSLFLLNFVVGNPTQTAHQKRSISQNDKPLLQDFDALGAWFDSVAAIKHTSIPRQPNVSVAIVGAGVSGLATALMLDSVGVHNWEIIEASERVGGRYRTKFVGGTQEYAEMGPMRLPWNVTYKSDNATEVYTDHRLTFDLADWLNELNGNDPKWKINFIPWIQHHPNELYARGTGRLPDGRVPTRADIEADPTLGSAPVMISAEYNSTKQKMNQILMNEKTLRAIQRDPWRAHKRAIHQGLDDISEQAMMRLIWQASENVTDAIWTSSDYDVFWDEMHHNSNLELSGSPGTLGLTEWKCVDGGFNRITDAFIPHVSTRLMLNCKVNKLEPIQTEGNQTRTRLSWHTGSGKNRTTHTKEYDYTIMAVPFTMTRFMDLPSFSSVLSRAMRETGLRFQSACKVALLFRERFWEKGPRPIFGGYSRPESPAVGSLYYPMYGFNETGRPGLIMHYRGADWSDFFPSFSTEQHVELVLDAIADLHGQEVRELYTGEYERLCWQQDEHTAMAWCRPNIGQHKLYIPSYHRTEHNTIFIGEHTAPTHAWTSSALYSSVRGAVQLLLQIGMVEEAKEINAKWMGRWLELKE
ncbi:amine oxidase [Lojkania enalia]|uniref:Amine oxidase n=1 Tax=Lojkania enalia TaxID=147567 RepID=A0A9P4MXW2_9PLEO|nr:amine oxidase [Didymosphaeria enalia]